MALPAPQLDDRTFQGLVDEAKRMVQQRCPTWTDHNVHDPGVTLIETFAYMVDQLIWRVNKVPDRLYVKFLEMLGMRLQPPTAARAGVTFWLSGPQENSVVVPAGTEVATPRTEEEAISFTTVEDLDMVPTALEKVATEIDNLQVDTTDNLWAKQPFYCFDRVPKPGDAFYIGLNREAPKCAVRLRFDCNIEGVGVNPLYPPIVWEAWTGSGWTECEVERDETGGLNKGGDVVLHLPPNHTAHAGILKMNAGWIRCKVVPNEEWQPAYSASPRIISLEAATVGGTTPAVNAEIVHDEIVGMSEGVAGQRFLLQYRPVVPIEGGYRIDVSTVEEGWQEWVQVDEFALSSPDDHHFVIDEVTGEIVFGPAVRETDGTVRQFGAIPEKGLPVRIREYRSGGGRKGNVAANAIAILRSTIPFVDSVTNRYPAAGGLDGEGIEDAKLRGSIMLRTRHRAVTRDDFEHLALDASKDVARAKCVPAGEDGVESGGVRVLLVPRVADGPAGSLDFTQMAPPDELFATVRDYLDERRTVGARVVVETAAYVPFSIVARLRGAARYDRVKLEKDALAALYEHFHPLRGGPDGKGWPFGRSVVPGEVFSVLQRVPGVEFVEDIRLYQADPLTGERPGRLERVDPGPNELVFSFDHQVAVL